MPNPKISTVMMETPVKKTIKSKKYFLIKTEVMNLMENYLKPKKSLGQHFLKCPPVIQKILEAAEINPSDEILEIGPGTGVLTIPLARLAKKIIAVEKDEKLAEKLKNNLQKKKSVMLK